MRTPVGSSNSSARSLRHSSPAWLPSGVTLTSADDCARATVIAKTRKLTEQKAVATQRAEPAPAALASANARAREAGVGPRDRRKTARRGRRGGGGPPPPEEKNEGAGAARRRGTQGNPPQNPPQPGTPRHGVLRRNN